MRIRFHFAAAFLILLVLSSSAGLLPHSALPSTPEAAKPYIPPQSDKALHFLTFFALTLTFYFILDTSRKRVLNITLIVCTLVLGVGSEVAQGLLPNDREFDLWDVLANVLGSLAAVGLAGFYHRRAAERRRKAKYSALTGAGEEDLELGEALPSTREDGQEIGIVVDTPAHVSVEEELDNWDENAADEWDEDDDRADAKITPATSSADSEEPHVKKVAVD